MGDLAKGRLSWYSAVSRILRCSSGVSLFHCCWASGVFSTHFFGAMLKPRRFAGRPPAL
jgi:hypothetical protein